MDVEARSADDSIGDTNDLATASVSLGSGIVDESGSWFVCRDPNKSVRSQVWSGAVNGSAICRMNQIARMRLNRDDTV